MKKNNGKIDFILFGEGNYNTLGVLHCMAAKGIDVFLLLIGSGKRLLHGEVLGYSKYARYGYSVLDEREGLEWLLAHQSDFPQGTIIYPTSDTAETLLDAHYDELSAHFHFPHCGKQGEVTRLMEKNVQTALAAQHGIRTLQSLYTNNAACDLNEVTYPCMVKPLISISGSKGDMRVCANRDELDEALASAKHTKEFIIQQYIQNEADLLFLGIRLPNGEVWIPSLVKKPGVSSTGEYTHAIVTTAVSEHLPEFEEVKSFVSALNYVGPFSIEFGLEKGKNYFFEINLRNDGTSHYPLSSGVNIAYVYYRACKGELTSDDMAYAQGEYLMVDEVLDIRRVLSREISFGEWWKFFRSAKAYRSYVPFDKRLAVCLVPMFISRLFGKVWRTLFKKS